MRLRIFKENSLDTDEQSVSSLSQAAVIYARYFANGYVVRVQDVETGVEYAMSNDRLVPIPNSHGGTKCRAESQKASA